MEPPSLLGSGYHEIKVNELYTRLRLNMRQRTEDH